jgi:hypothetical protein
MLPAQETIREGENFLTETQTLYLAKNNEKDFVIFN